MTGLAACVTETLAVAPMMVRAGQRTDPPADGVTPGREAELIARPVVGHMTGRAGRTTAALVDPYMMGQADPQTATRAGAATVGRAGLAIQALAAPPTNARPFAAGDLCSGFLSSVRGRCGVRRKFRAGGML